jgi:hypothetical protein
MAQIKHCAKAMSMAMETTVVRIRRGESLPAPSIASHITFANG